MTESDREADFISNWEAHMGANVEVIGRLQAQCLGVLSEFKRYRPYSEKALLMKNVKVRLEHSGRIGDLFRSVDMKVFETGKKASQFLELKGNILNDLGSEKLAVVMFDQTKDGVEEKPSREKIVTSYDFSKCHVLTVGIDYYENGFPFNFYWDMANYRSTMGIPAPFPEKNSPEKETENEEDGHPAYQFRHDSSPQLLKEWDRENLQFPHSVYFARGLQGVSSVLSFGGCHSEGIHSGIAWYDLEADVKNIESTQKTMEKNGWAFFRGDHVLCAPLISSYLNSRQNLTFKKPGGLYLFRHPMNPIQKENLQTEQTTTTTTMPSSEENGTDFASKWMNPEEFEAQSQNYTNMFGKKVFYDCVCCKYEIASQLLKNFKTEIAPQIITTDLENVDMKLFYFESGFFTENYQESIQEGDLKLFQDNVYEKKSELEITLRLSILVFPKENYIQHDDIDLEEKEEALFLCADYCPID